MPVFKDQKVAVALFDELWNKMIKETEFGPRLKEGNISVLFKTTDPEIIMFVDEHGAVFGKGAESKDVLVTMRMSADVAHRFWLDQLNVPKALALRQITAKGPMTSLLQMLPLLKPGKALYPGLCKKHNIPLE